jgi:hypothetical protein
VSEEEYILAVIAQRCPEVADLVLPVTIFSRVLEALYAIEERLGVIEAADDDAPLAA